VKAQAYPPLLVTAGLNDPRVTYWEPAKWVAKLRELKTDDNELLLKTNMGAGHGGKSGRFESLQGNGGGIRLHPVANAAGKIIVSAKTTWALIDRSSGRLMRVPKDVAAPFMP
jgi:acyl-CoA thioesterase FadM